MYQWLAENDFEPQRIGMFEDRFNVFAELPGEGIRPSLAFNSHIDTWMRRDHHLIFRDPNRREFHTGWEDGDLLRGNGGERQGADVDVHHRREGPARLRRQAERRRLPARVAGETGQEPVHEFQGKRYLSKEVGARCLPTRRVAPTPSARRRPPSARCARATRR